MKFLNLKWIKGERRHLVQGVKGNRVPRGALYGGHGSFMVSGSPTELLLTVEDSNGKQSLIDVIDTAKEVNNWKKLSDNRFNNLKEKLQQKGEIDMDNLEEELRLD